MMSPFAYTAIIPCHNAQRTLPQALDSLARLDPPPARVVVVDDASTDQTSNLAQAHPNVKVIRFDRNAGPSRARNAGAAAADTPWLLFLDSDVYLHAEGLSAAVDRLQSEPELSGVMGVFEPGAPSGPFAGRFKNFYRHHEIAAMPNPPHVFTSACFLIRRDAYDEVGGFDESYGLTPCEDNEFYFRLVAAGHGIEYLTSFSFAHDKPLTLGRLLREDAQRAESIVRNLRGELGASRTGFGAGERFSAAAEMLGGVGLLAGPAICAAGFGIDQACGWWPVGSIAAVAIWLLAAAGLACVNASILKAAWRDQGPSFAAGVYWYRAWEMLAAAVGIFRALLIRRSPGRETDEQGGRSGHVAAT